MNRPKVAVLMSTYNGEKYIREQIDSILAQKDVDVTLFIRDDGSTDETINIVKEYIHGSIKENGISRIHIKRGKNAGPGSSFMRLLYSVPDTFDYYAFSDQDDIWLEDKLYVAVNTLKKTNKMLYTCNLMCVDKDGNEIGLRNQQPADHSCYAIMLSNKTNGCTMVFTNELFKLVSEKCRRPKEVLFTARCHDTWLGAVSAVMNEIVYDFDYHMYYRQHENNVIGAYDYDSFLKRAKAKYKKIINKSKRNGRSKLAKELYSCFPEYLESHPYIRMAAQADTIKGKLYLIKNYDFYRKYADQGRLMYILYVLFGLY